MKLYSPRTKYFNFFSLIFCLAILSTSCSSGGEAASEIKNYRLKAATVGAAAHAVSNNSTAMKVSFVGNCVTIASAEKLLNLVMATTKGEITITDLGKRSGMFCASNEGEILTVWVSTISEKVSRFDAKIGGATRSAFAEK